MNKILVVFASFIISTSLFAIEANVKCDVQIEKNSIICKFTKERMSEENNVTFDWIEPNGITTRSKDVVLPEYHSSVYDYRYIGGRTLGEWTCRVTVGVKEYNTTFVLK